MICSGITSGAGRQFKAAIERANVIPPHQPLLPLPFDESKVQGNLRITQGHRFWGSTVHVPVDFRGPHVEFVVGGGVRSRSLLILRQRWGSGEG
jgi:hypothetical protein